MHNAAQGVGIRVQAPGIGSLRGTEGGIGGAGRLCQTEKAGLIPEDGLGFDIAVEFIVLMKGAEGVADIRRHVGDAVGIGKRGCEPGQWYVFHKKSLLLEFLRHF